ncbi:MAG: dephospho-CoA kinase [Asticcacaulis sp.]
MIHLGLTGSIGMGKSTVADMFRAEGIEVSDADQIVHTLYTRSDPLKAELTTAFGDVVTDNVVDRAKLSAKLQADPNGFKILNAIVHPYVTGEREWFISTQKAKGARLIVSDIPLLFETGLESLFDKVLVVSASAEIQAARVLARPGMTPQKFAQIVGRQMPDAEKRQRADYVINTGQDIETTRKDVKALINQLIGQ